MIWVQSCIVAIIAAAASAQLVRPFVPILSQDFQIAPDNRAYSFSYSTGDGSSRQEAGQLRAVGNQEAYQVQGSYAYTLPEGIPVQVSYVADEFGYQPSGPGVHPDIAKAVAQQVAEARANPNAYNQQGFNFGRK